MAGISETGIPQVAPFRLSDYMGAGIRDATGMFRLSEAMKEAPLQNELNQQKVQMGRYDLQAAPLQAQSAQLDIQAKKQKLQLQLTEQLVNQHKGQVAAGMPEDQSLASLTQTRNAMLPQLVSDQILTPADAQRISQIPIDKNWMGRAEALLMSDPQYRAALSAERANKALEERISHDKAMEAQANEKEKRMAKQAQETLNLRKKATDARIDYIQHQIKKQGSKLDKTFLTGWSGLIRQYNSIASNPMIPADQKWQQLDTISQEIESMGNMVTGMGGEVPSSATVPTAPAPQTGGGWGGEPKTVTNPTTLRPMKSDDGLAPKTGQTKTTLSSQEQDWLNRAKQANPGASEQELIDYGRSINKIR